METFSTLLALCAGKSPVNFPLQRPVMRRFDIFFDLRLNKQFSKQMEAGDLRHHHAHCDVTVINTARYVPERLYSISHHLLCELIGAWEMQL